MTRPAESMEDDHGIVFSWYCALCGRELGVDLDAPTGDGMPPTGCPTDGDAALAWEAWNADLHPTYPHHDSRPHAPR